MHFCMAKIAIGGDDLNVYAAGAFDPVSWPEIMVLQAVHGDVAITDVQPFVEYDQNPRDERQRLSEKYGEEIVASVFGGRQVPREMDAAGVVIKPGIMWMNPITREVCVTGNGHASDVAPAETVDEMLSGTPRVGGRFAKAK